MSTIDHRVDIDGYVAGELSPDEARVVEHHLPRCAECRDEVEALRRVQDSLAGLPPEALLDGPPDDADLLLQRTLRQVRRESARQDLRRGAVISAVCGVLVLAALAGGVLLGRTQDRPGLVAAPPSGPSAAPHVPGTLVGSGTDPATGARLTVRVTPAAGWVRVTAAVNGIPAGQRCRVWVVARDGRREQAGSWLVSAKGAREGTTLDGAALVAPAEVAAVEVATVAGRRFVSVPL